MSKQGQRVLVTLRHLIISGELSPGQRLAEIPISERLGVSRTPIRLAFRALEHEGLLHKAGARGYMVRETDPSEIANAIEVRGVLEGLASRLATENGLGTETQDTLEDCLTRGDRLLAKGYLIEDDIDEYHDLNVLFHSTILAASGSLAVEVALKRNDNLPFASVASVAIDKENLEIEYKRLSFAHMQHRIIFEAILSGQAARAESVMREHANAAIRYAEMLGAKPSSA
ncbi:MAG: GntR family transcriptional regulator [Rhodospirillaceae bacterium]|jgi:GntR family transcriptional regulator, vanillate catabolism transcriptional regulator|nr:GntR family transcriptional regulator [Rhodospirillaceae bacterium]MBT6139432.1 GntR family transcriptional regulator [Rhodospirillaceae bacterium]